jgi:hypothetical protein
MRLLTAGTAFDHPVLPGEAMDPRHRRAYTGRSGQLAVMAELLDRGCNVALPEVDVGRDLFAFQDEEAGVTHIQVKTAGQARALRTEGAYSAQIDVPLEQLNLPDVPPLYYLFAMRLRGRWADFIIISRDVLRALRVAQDVGSEYTGTDGKAFLKLRFQFRPDGVTCSGTSFQAYRNAWEMLPPLRGTPGEASPPQGT